MPCPHCLFPAPVSHLSISYGSRQPDYSRADGPEHGMTTSSEAEEEMMVTKLGLHALSGMQLWGGHGNTKDCMSPLPL